MGLALFIVAVLTLAFGNAFGAMLWYQESTGAAIGLMIGTGVVGFVLAMLGLKVGKSEEEEAPPPPAMPGPAPRRTMEVQAARPPQPMPMPMAPAMQPMAVDPGYHSKGRGAVEGPNGYMQVVEGLDVGRSLPISPKIEITVGRAQDNLFPLQDYDISGYHCRMICGNDRILYQDLGSTNGGFLTSPTRGWMNQPFREGKIESGDFLQIGRTKIFFSFK